VSGRDGRSRINVGMRLAWLAQGRDISGDFGLVSGLFRRVRVIDDTCSARSA